MLDYRLFESLDCLTVVCWDCFACCMLVLFYIAYDTLTLVIILNRVHYSIHNDVSTHSFKKLLNIPQYKGNNLFCLCNRNVNT